MDHWLDEPPPQPDWAERVYYLAWCPECYAISRSARPKPPVHPSYCWTCSTQEHWLGFLTTDPNWEEVTLALEQEGLIG